MKEIDARLKQLAFSKIPSKEKEKAIIDMIIKEGGIDVLLLHNMGLWNGQ